VGGEGEKIAYLSEKGEGMKGRRIKNIKPHRGKSNNIGHRVGTFSIHHFLGFLFPFIRKLFFNPTDTQYLYVITLLCCKKNKLMPEKTRRLPSLFSSTYPINPPPSLLFSFNLS
jgi:hypothetical protein